MSHDIFLFLLLFRRHDAALFAAFRRLIAMPAASFRRLFHFPFGARRGARTPRRHVAFFAAAATFLPPHDIEMLPERYAMVTILRFRCAATPAPRCFSLSSDDKHFPSLRWFFEFIHIFRMFSFFFFGLMR